MSGSGHKYLEQLTDFGIKLGLDKIRFILSKLGSPHKKYRSILIAGTNGKGSVANFLASCLKENNYRVGFYTSPHLIRVEERIKINGKSIPSKVFDNLCLEIKNLCLKLPIEMQPTYFEALTSVAFEYFAREKIDICVCEVGMGGRFDATNVIDADLQVITPISYDHMEYLGNSIQEITSEKAGIIKQNSTVVSGKQIPEAAEVLVRVCKYRSSEIFFYDKDFSARVVHSDFSKGQVFNFSGIEKLDKVSITMLGKHQIHNAAVVLEALFALKKRGFKIENSAILRGMQNAIWPGRFQTIMKKPLVILDGGHNPAGIVSLKQTLKFYFPDKRFVFLIGILKDKKWQEMLKILSPLGKRFIFTKVDNPRSIAPAELAKEMKRFINDSLIEVFENPVDAFRRLISTKNSEPGVICGSLYLAGEILKILKVKV